MEIPLFSQPKILSELMDRYRGAFPDVRLFRHYTELVSAMQMSDKRSVAYLNSLSMEHVNQSNMSRFLASKIDADLIFRTNIQLINSLEKDGVLAIDDTIVEKSGKKIEAAGWIFDHSVGKTVWGIQMATSVFSGSNGIYPISAEIYWRREKLKKKKGVEEYRTKIDMQRETIGRCLSAGLNFHTVTGDIWYFTKSLVKYLDSEKLDWVFQSKGNRKIKIERRWNTLELVELSYPDAETISISGNVYSVWEIEGKIKDMGCVKVIVSEGINGRRYYVSNRTDWTVKKILEIYLRRWDIEVIHRDLKQDGLGHIFIRKLCNTKLYLRLIVSARVLLEISSIRSLDGYPDLQDSTGKRKRWISFEFLQSLLDGFRKYGEQFIQALKKSMTNPYRSTKGILRDASKLNSI